jgi:hypothetical protein
MSPESFASIAGPVSAFTTGFVFGLAYFVALRGTVALIAAGRGWLRPSALTLGRITALALVLTFAARLGAAPLLATFLGLVLARAVALRSMRGGS